ncbi:MAG: hypothetical protein EP146_15255 [Oscillibacter sp.]|uniref:hypothetical protein n=1 Tax=Oscillibacter sp. TaxID=1945593 RepID=UPI00132693F3|nr:hypothetical protein [Oscillibacter sp.]MUU12686.1 hypothetical protein [Oscillibacter sp.]
MYKNLVNYTDHVADNIDVPDRVLSAAKDAVLSALDYRRHTGAMGHGRPVAADGHSGGVGRLADRGAGADGHGALPGWGCGCTACTMSSIPPRRRM